MRAALLDIELNLVEPITTQNPAKLAEATSEVGHRLTSTLASTRAGVAAQTGIR